MRGPRELRFLSLFLVLSFPFPLPFPFLPFPILSRTRPAMRTQQKHTRLIRAATKNATILTMLHLKHTFRSRSLPIPYPFLSRSVTAAGHVSTTRKCVPKLPKITSWIDIWWAGFVLSGGRKEKFAYGF